MYYVYLWFNINTNDFFMSVWVMETEDSISKEGINYLRCIIRKMIVLSESIKQI